MPLAVLSVLGAVLAGCASGTGAEPVREDPRHAAAPPGPAVSVAGRTTATYRAAGPRGAAPEAALMRRVAGVLRARAAAFGLDGPVVAVRGATVTVTASGPAADALRQIAATGDAVFRPVLDPAAVPTALRQRYAALDCDTADTADTPASAAPRLPTVACRRGGPAGRAEKLVLGPAALDGTAVSGATAADSTAGGWAVELRFTARGRAALAALTAGLARRPAPANRLAFLVDGAVVSAPAVTAEDTAGTARIGGLTPASARNLAALVGGGPLPVGLALEDVTTTSS
ncbi:hypothetical protein [Streptomyces sp. HPF1205]|uniref:SecDF P1 head subdomain-containing protein n=1 Tax=Streptomyces sp. HPF1205 TaxID=2873262 RepID=UPI001CEDF11E|nr:hypothetical protein [Streptomyces sp. HPF1205]